MSLTTNHEKALGASWEHPGEILKKPRGPPCALFRLGNQVSTDCERSWSLPPSQSVQRHRCTKLEFGLDPDDNLVLIDEVLTPDSSRFWPASDYRVGISPPSFDKQFVRDYLETLDWDKRAPAPTLPVEILERTADKYREALERLTL